MSSPPGQPSGLDGSRLPLTCSAARLPEATSLPPGPVSREEALKLIRREVRRREGILIDEEDLATAIHEMFSIEVREQVGPVKIRRRAKPRKQGATSSDVPAPTRESTKEPATSSEAPTLREGEQPSGPAVKGL
jgi:hypothetical protein